jgi:hypothetical protein
MGGRIVASELKHQVQFEAITEAARWMIRRRVGSGNAAASFGFDWVFISISLGTPSPLRGDFVGMFMVLLGLGGIDLSKILI